MLESGIITIETPLMIAAKNGVVEMVEKILKKYPLPIKDKNTEGKNIVLLAVEYRQKEVLRFLCKQKWLSETLFREVDNDGNNALHLAARPKVEPDWLNLGEINWFKLVKESMPRGLLEKYNKKMETPEDIFRESQKELMNSEGRWLAKTSQACSVVSTLVLSATFATRTSALGNYNYKGGNVILRNKLPVFKLFVGASYSAFFCALISTIFFLSIVASRSQSVASLRYDVFKLYLGMISMFISISCLWVSFCANDFFMLDGKNQKWQNALPRYIVLSLGIFLLVVTQLPTFFGPTIFSIFPFAAPTRKAARPIEYRSTKNNVENVPATTPSETTFWDGANHLKWREYLQPKGKALHEIEDRKNHAELEQHASTSKSR